MKTALLLLFFFIAIHVNAQNGPSKIHPYVRAGAGIPTGLFSSIYKLTISGKVGALYPLSQKTNLVAETGYMYFFKKKKSGGIGFLPLTGGLEYNIAGRTSFELMMGGALLTESPASLYFCVQPGVAFQLFPKNSILLDYTGFVSYGYVVGGLNFSYRYSF